MHLALGFEMQGILELLKELGSSGIHGHIAPFAQLHHAVSMIRALASVGAPWATQAVVEWLTSVQLELLRSGRSSRLVEQLSQKAVEDVSSGDQQSNGNGSPRLVEQA